MSELPLHPMVVHLPLALAVLMPLIAGFVFLGLRRGWLSGSAWVLVVGLQVLMTASTYVAMELGEKEEKRVEKVTGKSSLDRHEEYAEMLAALTVATTAIAVVVLLVRASAQPPLMGVALVLMLGQLGLGLRVGHSGGELVYVHQAASAYAPTAPRGLLPTPGQNTSESETPEDETDYAPGESEEVDEEPSASDED